MGFHADALLRGRATKSPGAARQLATFFCAAKRRVAKEKAALVSRRFAVSLCYSTSRAAVELALDMKEHVKRASAQTVLAEFPTLPATARRLTRGYKSVQSRELMFGAVAK